MTERFARECRILAALETPNIARLYDAGVDAAGAPYIAMEYVHGQPLVAWCDARGLDTPARVRLFTRVLDAVGHAHRRQILHRDLKPSNILVTEQGEVRLLDFGVARLLRADTDASLTQAWGNALTPAYASPELLRGEPVDLRSDVFSLGVVLHELLTGVRPGCHPARAPDRSRDPVLSRALREVLSHALAPDPVDRFADAASFAEALRPFESEHPGRWGIGPFRARPRLIVGAAAITLVAAVVAALLIRPAGAPAVRTIAVLPFTNLTGDPEHEILADGLAEEVANRLSAIPDLRVTGRTSSFSFKGKNEDLREVADKLGVASLLEGSLRGEDERLRVTVHLVDGRDGTRRWSSPSYEHEQSGILAAQDEIAQDVARALSVTLDVGELKQSEGGTRNLEAARRYWQWRELMLGESGELEDQYRMVRLLREAVRLDPLFVVAWDGLADSLHGLALSIGDTQPEQTAQLQAESEQAWRRVAELAPDSWVALRKRSYDLTLAEKWADSEAFARQLLESGPASFERAQPLADVLFATGRINEAIELQAEIMKVDPRAMALSVWQQFNFYAAGRFAETETEYRRSLTLDGNHSTSHFVAFVRGLAQQDSDPEELRALLQSVLSEGEWAPWWHDFGAAIPDRAAMLAVLRNSSGVGAQAQVVFADALGDRDLALRVLHTHLAQTRGRLSSAWYAPWLMVHSGARADPRFKELMREGGLADFWRQSGKWPDFCGPVGDDDFKCT
jgi:serine/threonine protein kinase